MTKRELSKFGIEIPPGAHLIRVKDSKDELYVTYIDYQTDIIWHNLYIQSAKALKGYVQYNFSRVISMMYLD